MFIAILQTEFEQFAVMMEEYSELEKALEGEPCSVAEIIPMRIEGKTYRERRCSLREIAQRITYAPGLSYGELNEIYCWLEKMAARYGLVREFIQEGLI